MARGVKGSESVEFRKKDADDLVRVLKMGQPLSVALSFSGISKAAYQRWVKFGERANAPEEVRQFTADVAKAKEAAKIMALGSVFKGMGKDWKAGAWFLGVTRPAEFGQKIRVTLEEEFDHAIANLEQDFSDQPELLGKILASIARKESGTGPGAIGTEALVPEPDGDPEPS